MKAARVWRFGRASASPSHGSTGSRAKPPKDTRIYDLRSTFASNALVAGVATFELARIMGTSIRMIERSYGALIQGASDGIAARPGEVERRLGQERANQAEHGGGRRGE